MVPDRTLARLRDIRPIVLVTHRRSGTHLALDFIRRHFPSTNTSLRPFESPHRLYANVDRLAPNHPRRLSPRAFAESIPRCARPLVKTHDTAGWPSIEGESRAVLEAFVENATYLRIIRDGRAVLASWWAYDRQRLDPDRGTFSAFIRSPAAGFDDRPTSWRAHHDSWSQALDPHTIRFSDIVKNPRESIRTLEQILDETPSIADPLLPPRLGTRWSIRLARIRGNGQSTTLPGPSGVPSVKWPEAFEKLDDRRFFDEKTGDLLVQLGYEPDRTWVNRAPEGNS